MRREGSQRISPSCQSYCARADGAIDSQVSRILGPETHSAGSKSLYDHPGEEDFFCHSHRALLPKPERDEQRPEVLRDRRELFANYYSLNDDEWKFCEF